jgi:acetoin utilization deacetylase AcuC-like enzyme
MVADSGGYSPSAAKPAAAVASWQQLGIPISIKSFEAVTREQIKRAHDPKFVDDLLDLRIANGHGNRSPAVATSLPFTTGSLLAAAREALANGIGAVSPTSGFHHAGHARAGGFCSLNGLMVAALNLPDCKVGVLDFDMHYGDGTDSIIRHLSLNSRVVHRGHPGGGNAEAWLKTIPGTLDALADCDVVLYQAGADPHINDPLGGWLTSDQMRMRDRLVFAGLRERGVPVAWNLAGGYQKPFRAVLNLHDATMQECAAAWLD